MKRNKWSAFPPQKRSNKTKRGNIEIVDSLLGNVDPSSTFSRYRKIWELVFDTHVALLRSYWLLLLWKSALHMLAANESFISRNECLRV